MDKQKAYEALSNAHDAGDVDAATEIAEYIKQLEAQEASSTKQPKQQQAAMPVSTPVDDTAQEPTDPEAALIQSSKSDIPPDESKLSIAQVAEDPELFRRVNAYMKASGQDPFDPNKQTPEEYVDKFLSERTFKESSITFGGAPELAKLVGGNTETKKAIAEGIHLYNNMANRGGVRPIIDVAKGMASDLPLFAVTGGAGKVAGQATLKAAVKGATQKAITTAGRVGIAGAEAVSGAGSDIISQRIDQETKAALDIRYFEHPDGKTIDVPFIDGKPTEDIPEGFVESERKVNLVRTGAVALFSGTLGYLGARKAVDSNTVLKQGEQLDKALKSKNLVPATPTSPATPIEEALVDPITKQMDEIYDQYVKQTGKDLLDTIDPVNGLTDAKVRQDMSKAAVRIAVKVIQTDSSFQLKPNQKISSAINNVFANLDKIDNVTLERALAAEGITAREFAMMNKSTVSQAASNMKLYSDAARLLKTLTNKDSAFEKRIKDLYEFEDVGTGFLSRFNQGQQALAREWKAWITSGVDNTARNVLSAAAVLSLKTGVQFMEGTAFSIGSALSNAAKGKRASTFYKSMGETIKDSFGTYYYLKNNGLSDDITQTLLKENPTLRNQIIQALQETGNREVSIFAKWANSFNVATDGFIRKAVFTASVDRQLRRTGKDLYKDFLATNTGVPSDILKQATKEALQTTFSYMPSRAGDNLVASSVERGAGSVAAEVISAIDKTPLLNFALPFPRYMANAMAFVYRYSPVGSIGAGQELIEAAAIAGRNPEKATMLFRQASEKLIQAAMGTAALAAAYDYRKQNPDVPWYEVKTNNNTTVDVRPLGIPAPYFAMADVMMRHEQGTLKAGDTKAAIESITGLKVKAGSQDTYIDKLIRAYDSEESLRAFMIENGKFVGDIAGGFTQPFVIKQLVDLVNSVSKEGTKARDPNVIESENVFAATAEAAVKRVMNKLPILKQQLPEAVVRLNPDEIAREGEFVNRLVGFRQIAERTPAEQEVIKLNLDPYSLYGTSSGNKKYDRAYIDAANDEVIKMMDILLKDKQYQALPDVEKNIAASAVIREAAKQGRQLVDETYKANDLQEVYKQRYMRLPAIVKRAINRRYAEQHSGTTLEESKDFMAIDKYVAELEGRTKENFAIGGLASKLIGKATKSVAKDAIAETEALLGKKAAKEVPVEPLISKEAVTEAPKEALEPILDGGASTVLPSAEKALVEAPIASKPGVLKGYKPFADEDYDNALAWANDFYGEDQVKNWNVADPEGFADLIHSTIKTDKKIKWDEGPELPSKAVGAPKKIIDDVAEATYDADNMPINESKGLARQKYTTEADDVVDDTESFKFLKAGDLNADLQNAPLTSRKSLLDKLKQVRTQDFKKIIKDKRSWDFDENVMAVTQADFRFSKGFEVNPSNKEMMNDYFKMVAKKQKQYDALKERYKDVPPIKLWHGSSPENIEAIRSKGFANPQKDIRSHSELDVGGPSFTRDIGTNFRSKTFGGTNPDQFVALEIPYADYVFSRVNMPTKAYSDKNINVIARTINGSNTTVRPLGLPNSSLYETEDAFIEADKITRLSGFKPNVADEVSGKVSKYLDFEKKRIELYTELKKMPTARTPIEAVNKYKLYKQYLNSLLKMSDFASVKSGTGHQYINQLMKSPIPPYELSNMSQHLGKDRGNIILDIRQALMEAKRSEASDATKFNKAINELRSLTKKMSRGGLVA